MGPILATVAMTLRGSGMRLGELHYLPGHSKGRRREVYAAESRHWAQLQKGPNKKEETEKDKKEEERGGGIWKWKGTRRR